MPGPDFDFESQRPARRPRRTSILTYILLANGGIALFLCCGTCIFFAEPWRDRGSTQFPNRATEKNYEDIYMGMPFKEVEAFLGPTTIGGEARPDQVQAGKYVWDDGVKYSAVKFDGSQPMMWDNSHSKILVSFDKMPPDPDSKVVSKTFWMQRGNTLVFLTRQGTRDMSTQTEFRLPLR